MSASAASSVNTEERLRESEERFRAIFDRQLLQNLISNALKFHRKGVPPAVTVSVEVHGDAAELRVEDNGMGFEEQYLERIFAPFERLHGRSGYEGTGMGLAIRHSSRRRDCSGARSAARTYARGSGGTSSRSWPSTPLHGVCTRSRSASGRTSRR